MATIINIDEYKQFQEFLKVKAQYDAAEAAEQVKLNAVQTSNDSFHDLFCDEPEPQRRKPKFKYSTGCELYLHKKQNAKYLQAIEKIFEKLKAATTTEELEQRFFASCKPHTQSYICKIDALDTLVHMTFLTKHRREGHSGGYYYKKNLKVNQWQSVSAYVNDYQQRKADHKQLVAS